MIKVLLVEDEILLAELLVKFLSDKNIEVDVANDLPQAMEKYNTEYDVCLLDLNLKGELSFPLLKRIKEEKPETLAFIFSGLDSEEYVRQAKELGADGFIPKPYKMEFLENFLLEKIAMILKKKEHDKDKKK